MEDESKRSHWYNELSEKNKEMSDGILSFLNGLPYNEAKDILYATMQEIGLCAKVKS